MFPPCPPPLEPLPRGLFAPQELHHSYLALSVTCVGTGTERAAQEPARDEARHRSLLGALAFTTFYVAVRSWEPWRLEPFTAPFALGSLGVKSFLRHRSLLGALKSRPFTSPTRKKIHMFRHLELLRAFASKLCPSLGPMGAGALASRLSPSLGRLMGPTRPQINPNTCPTGPPNPTKIDPKSANPNPSNPSNPRHP